MMRVLTFVFVTYIIATRYVFYMKMSAVAALMYLNAYISADHGNIQMGGLCDKILFSVP
jgi:hypothetical protein